MWSGAIGRMQSSMVLVIVRCVGFMINAMEAVTSSCIKKKVHFGWYSGARLETRIPAL